MYWFVNDDRYSPQTEVAKIRAAIRRWGIPGELYVGIRFECFPDEVEPIRALLTPEERAVVFFT